MPYVGHDLDDACWGESILFDLSAEQSMSAGEHITSVENWQIRNAAGSPNVDATPSAVIDGDATFDGMNTFQRLTFPDGRSTFTRYEVFARVRTNFNNAIVLSSRIFVKPIRLADVQFRKIDVGSSLIHTFNFDKDLRPGEDIVSAAWGIRVAPDSPNPDSAVATRLVDNPVNGRFETHHRLTFGSDIVAPVLYLAWATIVTTFGNVMKLFSYEKAIPSLVSSGPPPISNFAMGAFLAIVLEDI